MTRILVLSGLSIALGACLGLGSTWYEFSQTQELMNLPAEGGNVAVAEVKPLPPTGNSTGTPVAVVVDGDKHDFGLVEPSSEHRHTFVIKNDGDGVLEIKHYGVSCSLCVRTDFQSVSVPPGESAYIPVVLTAQKPGPQLNEAFEVTTNDPRQEHIRLQLKAYVTRSFRTSVEPLQAGTIPTDKEATVKFRVYGYYSDVLELADLQVSDASKRELIELESRKLEPAEFQTEEPRALAAAEVLVRIKPGLPVGPLSQAVSFIARGKPETQEMPLVVTLEGKVSGDVSLLGGAGYSAEKGILSLGRVSQGATRQAKLNVMVRGEHRDEVQLSIASIDPEGILQATIGERKVSNEVHTYPLTVSIDPSAPSINRLGTEQYGPGKIVIQTTHPTAKELTLLVRFAVD